jgi:hypothetical protein
MRRALSRLGLVIAAVIAAALVPGGSFSPAAAAPITYSATLSGAQVVPPVQTAASGLFRLVIESQTGQAEFEIVLFGITAQDVETAELRQGAAGANGVLVQKLTPGNWTQINGSIGLGPSQVAALNAGLMYVEVRSVSRGALIRGQLLPPGASGLSALPTSTPVPTAVPTVAPPPPGAASQPAQPLAGLQIVPPSTGSAGLRR